MSARAHIDEEGRRHRQHPESHLPKFHRGHHHLPARRNARPVAGRRRRHSRCCADAPTRSTRSKGKAKRHSRAHMGFSAMSTLSQAKVIPTLSVSDGSMEQDGDRTRQVFAAAGFGFQRPRHHLSARHNAAARPVAADSHAKAALERGSRAKATTTRTCRCLDRHRAPAAIHRRTG